jgi:glycosyltransferase involved in cell wall biosynthesis
LAARRAVAPPERLVLIENAIDASYFSQRIDRGWARAQLGITGEQVVVGFVGRLARQKGVDCLIQAARLVVGEVPNLRFVLVGEGEMEGAVRHKISAHGLDSHVMLTGFRTDIPQMLAALDIFVLPSRYEGLPYTLMEAMASGCATVATEVGGNRDLIQSGSTGILVPPSAPRALADALLRLAERPDERERLGRAAMSAAQERATPKEMTLEVMRLYGQVLERKGNRA